MEKLNTQTLVHVGAELVVAGGIVFWSQRKFADLQGQITDLQDKLSTYEKIIHQHEQIFRQIFGGGPPPIPNHSQTSTVQKPHPQQSRPPPQMQTPRTAPQTPQPPPTFELEEENIDDEEYDKLLQEELDDIEKSRTSSDEKDFIEIDTHCDDGVCTLKKKTRKNKKLKKSLQKVA